MPERLFARFDRRHPGCVDSIMLERIRAFDWAASPVGPIDDWPEDLRSAVRMALLSASCMAVLIGREGVLVHNDAMRDLFGDQYDRALGQPIAAVLPDAASRLREAIDACHEGRGSGFSDEPMQLLRNGVWRTCWFNASFTPIADERANVFATLVVLTETSDRVRALLALRHSRQRMALALDAGGVVATWDLNLATERLTLDGPLTRELGIASDDVARGVDVESLADSLHSEDRTRFLEDLRGAVARRGRYESRFRLVSPGGAIRWLISIGRPVADKTGRIDKFAGVLADITEQTETEAALRQSNLRFDILAEAVPVIVWSTDAEGLHDYVNGRWIEFTGLNPDEIRSDNWLNLVHPDDRERVKRRWVDCLETGNAYDIDYRFRHRDGGHRWLKVLAMPLRDVEGRIRRWYGTATDIHQAKQVDEQRDLIAHELDHRIKNLFALAGALVTLTLRDHPELRPAAEKLSSRLTALNDAHALIYGRSSDDDLSIRALLARLLAPYVEDGSERVSITGADQRIGSRAMTAMALTFHELITNAAKYGGLAEDQGRLHIDLRPSDGRLVIDWKESALSGAGRAPGGGFGSRLLQTVVEGQLRGVLSRQMLPTGFACVVDLPLASLDAPD